MQSPRIKAHGSCPIVDHDELTVEQFHERFLSRNLPVIIRGAMQDWKALERWNEPGYLESACGDLEIPITEVEDGHISSLPKPLKQYWKELREKPNGHYRIITERPIVVFRDRPGMLVDLKDDLGFPPYLDHLDHTRASLFAGHDSRSPLHYHPGGEVVLCQVVGQKRILCYPPDRAQSRALYPHPWYTNSFASSRIIFTMDGRVPDPERFPRYREARPVECMLNPGDLLYIPIYWWHHGFCQGMSVSVAHFYTAPLRKRYMMARGIRANLLNYRVARYWFRRLTGTLEGHLADGGRRFERRKAPI